LDQERIKFSDAIVGLLRRMKCLVCVLCCLVEGTRLQRKPRECAKGVINVFLPVHARPLCDLQCALEILPGEFEVVGVQIDIPGIGKPRALVRNVPEFTCSLFGLDKPLQGSVRFAQFVVCPSNVALRVEFQDSRIRSFGDLVARFRALNGLVVEALAKRLRPQVQEGVGLQKRVAVGASKGEAALEKHLRGSGIGLLAGKQATRLEHISAARQHVAVAKRRRLIEPMLGFREVVLVGLGDSEKCEAWDREIRSARRRFFSFYELENLIVEASLKRSLSFENQEFPCPVWIRFFVLQISLGGLILA
jgi:hypothetical protein